MKKYVLILFVSLLSSLAFADEKTEMIQTDLKFLCQIHKIEKRLTGDKGMSAADVTERISAMKTAAVRAQETKDAITAISSADKKEQIKLWKKFAKDYKAQVNCR